MKKILILCVIIVFSEGHGYGQCNPYYELAEGNKWEITNYNPKGKFQGKQLNEIKALNTTGNGWQATIHMILYDKKDKVIYDKDIDMSCADGIVSMDMTRMIPDEQLEGFKDMNMQLEMDNLEIPSDLQVGMVLDEGSLTLSGDLPMTMTVNITDREVTGKESITTPAGTFDCYKISYTINSKMLINREDKGVDYIAEGIGMVRTESYNKSGKLTGYSELTSR